MWIKKNIIEKLDLYNSEPSEYWKLIKELKVDESKDNPFDKISSDAWVSHCSDLFSIKNQFQKQNNYYEHLLQNCEKIQTFTELDSKITEKEMLQSVANVKRKKYAGLDGVKMRCWNVARPF